MNTVTILNTKFELTDSDMLLAKTEEVIKNRNYKNIFCCDYRLLNIAKKINLNTDGTLIYPDSSGIYFLLRILYPFRTKGFSRIVSTDFHLLLLELASKKDFKIFLLGDTRKILEDFKSNMNSQYSGLNIVGMLNGFKESDDPDAYKIINSSKADILLVGMGVPKQETWLLEHSDNLTVPVRITVGAFFTFYSGKIKRSPKILRILYLEWFYRFLNEPRRLFSRYFVIYPKVFILAIKERLL